MSKTVHQTTTTASTLAGIAGGITTPALTTAERKTLRDRNARTPDALIEMVSHLAQQGSGSVLGIPFDATTASATLASASEAKTTIAIGRQTLQRVEDDMLQQRLTVADPAFAIYTALRRLVRTKAGNALLPAYNQMKAIVIRRKRSKATDETSSTAPTAAPAAPAGASATPATGPAPVTPAPAQATAPKAAAATSN